jgi:small nuclear ribonucleoprotein (snRNP)-like protein
VNKTSTLETKMVQEFIGKSVIIRSDQSGVHHGTLHAVDGATVHLKDARRLWVWKIAGQGVSLSEVAILGVDHSGSKITMMVPDIVVLGVCEILPTHGVASATIDGAPIGQAS